MIFSSRVGERGQITIPKAIRDRHGLKKGALVEIDDTSGNICVRKSKAEALKIIKKYQGLLKRLGTDIEDVDEFIRDIRGE
jgi:AbrB family looped-hinge helix DNA binding protein